jgi:hypothetical protein
MNAIAIRVYRIRHQAENGGNQCQPNFGARICRYRCFLPDLAGFTTYRREATNTSYHNAFLQLNLAEREGFEPSVRYKRTHAFQACSLNRSDISPRSVNYRLMERKGKPELAIVQIEKHAKSA